LEIDPDLSVKVDMTQDDYSEIGVLFISEKSYGHSHSAAHRRSFSTRGNPTISDILNLIFTADENNVKLDSYKLSATGQGCAYWTYKFIERIEEAGYIERGAAALVFDEIQWHWASGRAESQLGLRNRQGDFV
jgi:hypothetical protein